MLNPPKVTILIPAFESSKFIRETLDSIADQSFQDFMLLISIDPSDDGTERVVREWCRDHGNITTKIHCQRARLGQVDNVNFLLDKCRTKFFMILPHDDLIGRNYLQKLISCLESNDQAILAFSDIEAFGANSRIISQGSTLGNKFERTLHYLSNNAGAEPFRGLINRELLSEPVFLFHNDCFDFAADTAWLIGMATKGALVRVPEILYRKRIHDGSLFNSWRIAAKEDKTKAWLEHCKDCLKVVFDADFDDVELALLITAIESRLVDSLWCPEELQYSEEERASLLSILDDTIAVLQKVRGSL